MNVAVLMGRLVADPDVRYTQGEQPMAIARYRLAVDRRGRKKDGENNADFINIVSFGKAGEFVEKYCKKGTKLVVRGHIQTGSYKNKNGDTVYTTDIVSDDIEFAESKASQSNKVSGADGFMSIPDGIDEELPFN